MRSQQDSMLDMARVVERRLSTGSRVQLRIEPIGERRVRILEYRRLRPNGENWQRQQAEEGHEHRFEQLHLAERFEDLWPEEAQP